MRRFFSDKKTVFSFFAYLLITIFIFSSSLKNSETSANQSQGFANTLSSIVSVITFDAVDLKKDGKTDSYPDEIKLILPQKDDYRVGETFLITHSFNDKRAYPCAEVVYSSSNPNVISVDSLGNATVLASGKTTITASVKNTDLSSSKTVVVGNGVYEPNFCFTDGEKPLTEPINAVVSSSNIGALYSLFLTADTSVNTVEISCFPENGLEIITNNKNIFFYTKSPGTFEIRASLTYDNVNGKSQRKTISQTINVLVDDTIPLPEKPVIDYPNTSETITLNLLSNQSKELTLNYDLISQNLPKSRFGIVAIKNDSLLSVGYPSENSAVDYSKVLIVPKKVGSSLLTLYYLSEKGLEKLCFEVIVSQGPIKAASINSAYDYAKIDGDLPLTILGDNKIVSNDQFDWSVSDSSIAIVKNGVVYGKKYGTITITAKAKFDENLVIRKTLTVRHSFNYVIRKLFGHFLIFLALSFFALIVYNKLSEILFKKHQKTLGNVLTLIVGFLTALISEILQTSIFVYGRTFSVYDIFIDFSGFCLGVLTFSVIIYIFNKIKSKKIAKN